MARPALILVVLLTAGFASADNSVTVDVGQTTTVDVGLAKGLNCDDLTVAQVEIRNRSADNNELVITGLKPGKTWCRAGTPTAGASALVHIRVVEKKD
jgi:hypothetical protein